MSPTECGVLVGVAVFVVATPTLYAVSRWYGGRRRRRSRIGSVAHQVDGPYRKAGQKAKTR